MRRAKLNGKISYRLTEEERRRIEEEAAAEGISAHDWCREAAVEKLRARGQVLTESERLIYEEIARVRFLLGKGFNLLAAGKLNGAEWQQKVDEVEKNSPEIAQALLKRRQTSGASN